MSGRHPAGERRCPLLAMAIFPAFIFAARGWACVHRRLQHELLFRINENCAFLLQSAARFGSDSFRVY
jgi:hypothetical protein